MHQFGIELSNCASIAEEFLEDVVYEFSIVDSGTLVQNLLRAAWRSDEVVLTAPKLESKYGIGRGLTCVQCQQLVISAGGGHLVDSRNLGEKVVESDE